VDEAGNTHHEDDTTMKNLLWGILGGAIAVIALENLHEIKTALKFR